MHCLRGALVRKLCVDTILVFQVLCSRSLRSLRTQPTDCPCLSPALLTRARSHLSSRWRYHCMTALTLADVKRQRSWIYWVDTIICLAAIAISMVLNAFTVQ